MPDNSKPLAPAEAVASLEGRPTLSPPAPRLDAVRAAADALDAGEVKALVPVPHGAPAPTPAVASEFFGALAGNQWSSLPDWRETMIALSDDAAPLGEMIGEPFQVEHIVAQRVRVTEEDGTIVDKVRVVFIDPDGNQFASTSEGIMQSLMLLIGLRGQNGYPREGMPPFDPPETFKVKQINTRSGHRTYKLIPVLASRVKPDPLTQEYDGDGRPSKPVAPQSGRKPR